MWRTVLYSIFLAVFGGIGVTAGAHRLWTHRCYKAKLPLRILLIIMNTISMENDVITWTVDHRVHHKYSETDADPHNATRGFFFSHIGWIMVKKHPKYFEKVKTIDFSDLYEEKLLVFQKKFYWYLVAIITFIIPTIIPMYFWNETLINAFFVATMFRIVLLLNITWLVNSAAHLYGKKPYDKHIGPVENYVVTTLAVGEGFHNYHHVYPWDYRAAELGNYSMNITTAFIDLMAKIGWAYDLKTVPVDIVQKRIERTGDGSHDQWGWGERHDISKEIRRRRIDFVFYGDKLPLDLQARISICGHRKWPRLLTQKVFKMNYIIRL
ncbi:acyl-CoA Delta-9 desaturase-like [Arctopsyche grandis]|uniref:acyl-CoA Delta-9 desaturase-like n=1 Tax=Arctopsyche grandis TaxID=121162 RepID=UPI00406D7364